MPGIFDVRPIISINCSDRPFRKQANKIKQNPSCLTFLQAEIRIKETALLGLYAVFHTVSMQTAISDFDRPGRYGTHEYGRPFMICLISLNFIILSPKKTGSDQNLFSKI